MSHPKRVLSITILLVFGFLCVLFSQTTSARFLLTTPSARSNALGGAGTALSEGAFSCFYNPAAITFIKPFDIMASFVEPLPLEENREYSAFSGILLQGDLGTLAFSLNIYALGTTYWTSERGEVLGIDKNKAWVYRLSYAYPVSKDLALGTTLNYLDYRLSDLELTVGTERGKGEAKSIFFNFGILRKNLGPSLTFRPDDIAVGGFLENITAYIPRNGFSLGLAVLNLGPKISFIDAKQADPIPAILSAGMVYHPVDSRATGITLALDLEKQLYESSALDYVRGGVELNMLQLFCVQAGYAWDTDNPKNSYPTYGFGLKTKFVNLEAARYQKSLESIWHYNATLRVEI